jgi:hypothetical protein
MKSTKMHKTLLTVLVSLLLLSVAMFTVMTSSSNKVSAAAEASNYFTGVDVTFKDSKAVATIDGNDDVLTIKNQLVVSDFELALDVPADKFASFAVVFENDAYYANGNVINGELKDKVENKLVFDYADEKAYFDSDKDGAKAFDKTAMTIKVAVKNGYLKATVNGNDLTSKDVVKDSKTTEYRKVKAVAGMAVATVKFEFKLASGVTTADFGIVSVNQKSSDANYKQTFELDSSNNIKTKAYPRVTLNEDFYKLNADGTYSVKKDVATQYTVSVKTYSVLANVTSGDIFVKVADAYKDNVWFDPSADGEPKSFAFKAVGDYEIQLAESDEKVYETLAVKVVDFDKIEDNDAPAYKSTIEEGAKASYELALRKAYYDLENEHHKPLGTSVTLPSLKDFVFDNETSYEDLKITVYYNTDTKDSATTSSLSLTINEAGDYEYYVAFEDKAGNKIEANTFVGDEDDDTTNDEIYKAFIFKFHVIDDAPITITKPVSQGKGFKGIEYVASKFDIDAAGCTTTYELYYNADVDADETSDGWVKIPKASTVTDETYDEDGFTYKEVQAIAYAGGLSFTPDRLGAYMIKCSATSSSSSRSAVEYSVISVADDAETVKIPSTWLKDNVWSVVFLSIGTLCLVGIIVLLCIKPKEETEDDND